MRLEELLDAQVHHANVRKVDLVNDTTSVDVRYRLRSAGVSRRASGSAPAAIGESR